MEWKPRMIHSYPGNAPLPFFMSYPGYAGMNQPQTLLREKELLQDLEYLQQTYPGEVKRYQRRVAETLDRFDYEGSMIYDEYPDKYSLQRLTSAIVGIMQKEEQKLPEEERTTGEKWKWLEDMLQVLVCNEVYKRRHGGRRGFLKF